MYEITEEMASNTRIMKELKKNKGDYPETYNNIVCGSVNNKKDEKNDKNN